MTLISTPLPRAELIASWAYGPDTTPAKPGETPEPVAEATADTKIAQSIAQARTAVADAITSQHNDPDADSDPRDAKVMGMLENAAQLLDSADKAQQDDMAGELAKPAPGEEPPVPAPPVAASGGGNGTPVARGGGGGNGGQGSLAVPAAKIPPPGGSSEPATKPNPVDDDGNVADGAVCTTPDCGHLATMHANAEGGDNTGPCSTPGCLCEAMAVEASADDGPPGDDGITAASILEAEGLADVGTLPEAPAASASEESNPAPEMTGSENVGPAFTIPVGVIEGQPTGDGRQIAVGALTWRTPPMPLMLMKTSAHDASGMSPNDPAVLAGRIDSLERTPGENGTTIIAAKGFYLSTPDGVEAAALAEQMGRMAISADIAVQAEQIDITDTDQDGWPVDTESTLTEGVVMGFTQLPFSAFAACYIVLGDGTDPTPIPQAAEPDTTASGQLIHLMSFQECDACDENVEILVASAAGPVAPPAAWFENPGFELGDGRLVEIFSRRGHREGRYACPVTVTAAGQIYGHLAPFGVCHTGDGRQCTLAPRSRTDYAHFKRGAYIMSAEGHKIRVGVLTAETGHASTASGITAATAMAHYDNTGTAYADINVGEDEFGIWMAGAIRPNATPEQIRALTAAAPSGDWRGGELVAVLCVNQPGFPVVPVPREKAVIASGEMHALIAAGASVMDALAHPPEPETGGDPVLRAALAPMLAQAGKHARDRIAALL